jgi:peptidoglycan-associated lipoprotein
MRRLAGLIAGVVFVASGCATAVPRQPPAVDVSGHWVGQWTGYGIIDIPRQEGVAAELTQRGATGWGQVVFDGVGAAEAIPVAVRRAGATGIRVVVDVSGSQVRLTHELGGRRFAADLTLVGDRLVGHLRDVQPRVDLELVRAPAAAAATPAPVPLAAEPPPPPIAAATPEPPAPPAVAPVPPPAPTPPTPEFPERPAPARFTRVPALEPIYFDFDRAEIRPQDAETLDRNARWLREHPEVAVLIEGHCDDRGTSEYNLALGERRARAAMTALVSRGVTAARISLASYGHERPVCTERAESCWARNRRAVFLVQPQ